MAKTLLKLTLVSTLRERPLLVVRNLYFLKCSQCSQDKFDHCSRARKDHLILLYIMKTANRNTED